MLGAKAKNITKNKLGDTSRADSSVTWNEVKDIYAPILEQYEEAAQHRSAIDPDGMSCVWRIHVCVHAL